MRYINLILTFLLFFSFTSYSQIEIIEGLWISQQSNYTTAVFYDKDKFLFKNIGDDPVKETVIDKGKDFIITNLFNPVNGYMVQVKYTLLKNGNLHSEFSGDWDGVVVWEKQ